LKRKEIDNRSSFPLKMPTDTKDTIVPFTASNSSSNHYKSSSFSHLNINSRTLAKQRSSLGISLLKKNSTGASSFESVVKQEPESMESDYETSSTKLLLNTRPVGISTQPSGTETPLCLQSSSIFSTNSPEAGTVTAESLPPVQISSTQKSNSGSSRDVLLMNENMDSSSSHKTIESSVSNAAVKPDLQCLQANPSDPVSSKAPCGLSLISCDYGSSSSGNEDE